MKFSVIFHDFAQSSIMSLVRQYGNPKTVIEIGVFEGNTTFNMTDQFGRYNNEYKHYAIDPFGVSDDLPENVVDDAGKQFVENLESYELKDRIEFLNTTSSKGLVELINRGVKADLIYVDGDHRAQTVLEDMVLGFQALAVGGIMLCDDCVSWKHTDNKISKLQASPKLAVDAFVHCNWDRIEMLTLPNGWQTAFVRTA